MQGKFKIITHPDERSFIEFLLNSTASGLDVTLPLALQGLGEGWHISKLLHYQKLIEEVKATWEK